MSEEERLEFMHMVFGGRDGLFARNDPAAIRQLSFIVTKVLINGMSEELRSDSTHTKIAAVVSAVFGDRDLPVFYKVQLLNAIYSWLVKVDERGVVDKNRALAELLETVFASLGGVGERILQALLIEPQLFSEEVRQSKKQGGGFWAPQKTGGWFLSLNGGVSVFLACFKMEFALEWRCTDKKPPQHHESGAAGVLLGVNLD